MALFYIEPKNIILPKPVVKEIEKFSKEVMNNFVESLYRYAWEISDNRYFVCNKYELIISKSKEGLTFKEDATPQEREEVQEIISYTLSYKYKDYIELPDVQKFKDYIKKCKQQKLSRPLYFSEAKIAMNANYIVRGMNLTNSNKLYYLTDRKALMMKGNNITFYFMPVLNNSYNYKVTEL